jgi:hypothetical protein
MILCMEEKRLIVYQPRIMPSISQSVSNAANGSLKQLGCFMYETTKCGMYYLNIRCGNWDQMYPTPKHPNCKELIQWIHLPYWQKLNDPSPLFYSN